MTLMFLTDFHQQKQKTNVFSHHREGQSDNNVNDVIVSNPSIETGTEFINSVPNVDSQPNPLHALVAPAIAVDNEGCHKANDCHVIDHDYASPNPRYRQCRLVGPKCEFCVKAHAAEELIRAGLMQMKSTYCVCNTANCCCSIEIDRLSGLYSNKHEDEDDEQMQYSNSSYKKDAKFDENFFYRFDPILGKHRYFCILCVRYASKRKLVSNSAGDFFRTGKVLSEKMFRAREGMKRHLESNAHKQSVENYELENVPHKNGNFPSTEQKETATRNLCIASQLMANYHLPYRFYPQLCTAIHIMCEESDGNVRRSNLLGNNNQSHNIVPHAQYACYEAELQKAKETLESIMPATGQRRRFHVAADKGTSAKDATRQAIVETHIGSDGHLREMLVGVESVFDQTAQGAADQLTICLSKVLDTRHVAVISTDGAASYTGRYNGMIQLLKSSTSFSDNIIYLPDLCHRTERLLGNNCPAWVENSVAEIDNLISRFNSSPQIRNAIQKSGECHGDLFAMQTTCQTRYAEYMHRTIQSVFNNFKVMISVLSAVAQSTEYDQRARQRAEDMFLCITDPLLVARIMLIDNVYMHMEAMEKEAQSSSFGPFQYIRVTSSMKDALQTKLQHADQSAIDVITTGSFKHQYGYRGVEKEFTVNLRELQADFKKTTLESIDTHQVIVDAQLLQDQYKEWVDDLAHDFDTYIEIPPAVLHATSAFTLSEYVPFGERVEHVRQFMAMINTNFHPCSEVCQGAQKCICIEEEMQRFLHNANLEVQKEQRKNWKYDTCDTSGICEPIDASRKMNYSYSNIFAHYLADSSDKVRDELKIVNILRVLEIVQLLKASQSSTERVFSTVKQVVSGRFENRYRFPQAHEQPVKGHLRNADKEEDKRDYVAASVYLAMNSNIVTLDSKRARLKLLASGHEEALLSKKPVGWVGKAVSSTLRTLVNPKIRVKQKKNTLPLNKIRKMSRLEAVGEKISEEKIGRASCRERV